MDLHSESKQEELERNAIIMYPYIRNGILSHGRVAQILGIKKLDLIRLYDEYGFPYLNSASDYEDDLRVVDELKEII